MEENPYKAPKEDDVQWLRFTGPSLRDWLIFSLIPAAWIGAILCCRL